MKRASSGLPARILGRIAAPLAAVALSGCYASTAAIRSEDLPRMITAAVRDPLDEVTVTDERGKPVQIRGRLDAVMVIAPGPVWREERFEAPVLARIDGDWLTVWDREKLRSYAPPQIGRIDVQRYDTVGATRAGVLLTAFGGLTMGVGGVLIGLIPAAKTAGPWMGIPIMSAGVGLVVGGIPLIVAGNRAPAAVIAAGPGGIQLRF